MSDRDQELSLRRRLSGLSRLPLLRGARVDGEADRLRAQLEELQWAPAPQVEQYRQARLRSLLEHCQANVPFYRDEFRRLGLAAADIRGTADLKRLPKVTKSMLRADYARFCADGSQEALVTWPSSGSSGEPRNSRASNVPNVAPKAVGSRSARS